ncbi:flagellar basal body rod protein FlgC [Inquilinus sp. CAU 1745]|uniref:flagellar basal body rod protein FlgC n=1 Tax=Inquilinus sp. CAU 1745 TaxID=3140369 RepID=UPI00325C2E75
MDLMKSLDISASAMRAQGTRLRIVAENLANANSTGETPNDMPYRRQVVSFESVLDRATGAHLVQVADVTADDSAFTRKYEPGHPSADAEGYVLYPNVNSLVEMMDMREAQRSYEANLSVVDIAKQMVMKTIDMLRT